MFRIILAAAALAVASLALTPAASAHHRAYKASEHKGSQVYYSGTYANVYRDNGATYVHAYHGVSVYVGQGGGVHVSVGF